MTLLLLWVEGVGGAGCGPSLGGERGGVEVGGEGVEFGGGCLSGLDWGGDGICMLGG